MFVKALCHSNFMLVSTIMQPSAGPGIPSREIIISLGGVTIRFLILCSSIIRTLGAWFVRDFIKMFRNSEKQVICREMVVPDKN